MTGTPRPRSLSSALSAVLLTILLAAPLWQCARESVGLKKLDEAETSLQGILATVQQALSSGDAVVLGAKGEELVRLRLEVDGLKLKPKEESLRRALQETLDSCVDAAMAGSRGISIMQRGQAMEDSIRRATPRTAAPNLRPAVQLLREASVSLEQCGNALTRAGDALKKAHAERAALGSR